MIQQGGKDKPDTKKGLYLETIMTKHTLSSG